MRKRIYIAGPMTLGDRIENLSQALKAYRLLLAAGFAPLCPQLTFFMEPFVTQDHAGWLDADLPWVDVAEGVLRLPGESRGVEREVAHAASRRIPVFERVEHLFQHFGVCEHGQ